MRQRQLETAATQVTTPEIRELDVRLRRLTHELAALPSHAQPPSPTLGYHSQICRQAPT